MMALRLIALSLFMAGTANGQPYRWIDETGGVNYSDTLPPPGAKSVEIRRYRDNAIGEQGSYELDKAMRESPVVVYSHPDCKDQCQLVRDTLNKRGIPFTEVVVDDQPKQDELKRVSGGITVPVLVVGAQVQTVIDPEGYNHALDLAGYPPAGVARPRNQTAPPREEPQASNVTAEPAPQPRGPYAPR